MFTAKISIKVTSLRAGSLRKEASRLARFDWFSWSRSKISANQCALFSREQSRDPKCKQNRSNLDKAKSCCWWWVGGWDCVSVTLLCLICLLFDYLLCWLPRIKFFLNLWIKLPFCFLFFFYFLVLLSVCCLLFSLSPSLFCWCYCCTEGSEYSPKLKVFVQATG